MPAVALRTYRGIRLGVVAVIVALLLAVGREIASEPDACTQRSLSAYFHTSVMPVFVGALLLIGFAMIVLWGKTVVEDAALNLAGLLLIVVAIVPTLDANFCSLPPDLRSAGVDPESRSVADTTLILEHADTVRTTFWTFLVVVALVLVFSLVLGLRQWLGDAAPGPSQHAKVGNVATWALVAVVWCWWVYLFQEADDPDSFFNRSLHGWSANIGVGFIIVAVLAAGAENARSTDTSVAWLRRWKPLAEWGRWAWLYGALGLLMVIASVVIKVGDRLGWFGGWLDIHATFTLEVILIVLLGAYWVIQTVQRRSLGAPTY
ncbi:MAG: hypothetical protein WBP61_14900 [Nocardioides sp.]